MERRREQPCREMALISRKLFPGREMREDDARWMINKLKPLALPVPEVRGGALHIKRSAGGYGSSWVPAVSDP